MQPEFSRPDNVQRRRSRPIGLAAELSGADVVTLEQRFLDRIVRIQIEPELEHHPDPRLTLLTLCNHILRFCPNVIVGTGDRQLAEACRSIALSIEGEDHHLRIASDTSPRPDVTINVGRAYCHDLNFIAVNSTGWVARIACGGDGAASLPWEPLYANAIGAVGAGCLGSGEAFLRLIDEHPAVPRNHELSMLTGETGPIGTFPPGPELPGDPLNLDTLLAGCGGVSNGWAATVRHLPIVGRLAAVDRQAVGDENLGPYAVAVASDVGQWKVEVIRRVLEPAISVDPHPDEIDLFVTLITEWDRLPVPDIVITGLDDALPRHVIQRLLAVDADRHGGRGLDYPGSCSPSRNGRAMPARGPHRWSRCRLVRRPRFSPDGYPSR